MGLGKDISKYQLSVIAALVKEGKSSKEISSTTGLSMRSVQRWTKRCLEAGDVGPELPRKRPGGIRKTTPRTLEILQRQLDREPYISARELKKKNPQMLANVSVRTVQRLLHDDLGYRYLKPQRKFITARQQKKRVWFCQKYIALNEDKWKQVLWSGEATFTITSNQGKIKICSDTDLHSSRYNEGTVKHTDSVVVWGAFGYHGVGKLVILPKNVTINTEKYLELLADHLEDCFEICQSEVYQQDGLSAHTGRLVTGWLDFVGIEYIKDWPDNSLDISPIENLWAVMKANLRKNDTSSYSKLVAALEDIWSNFSPSFLQNLALSVPHRLKICLKKKGDRIRYSLSVSIQ
ncbi:Transposable element Tcb1 transposase [Portunus trituberculatus]|uniref:Transposable element Tcb1 transposase n=1 Tax=Portunus trituberculatus TaxID=210409 RepID=A0A5B7J2E2_PORTR|nr:Transposable element Tcb1 transposase [Portunus trituberculatus]